ncbi:MAG: type II secretion system protein [Clostridia bacterium]|nr:type II secretion system protein [Clostridia bacterium]
MKKLNKKGFTIVELVIVIAVIAILAAVLIPTFSKVIENANKSAAMQAARNAFTTWLADADNAKTLGASYKFAIQNNNLYFVVSNGQFSSTPETTYTGVIATISDGTLTGIKVTSSGEIASTN